MVVIIVKSDVKSCFPKAYDLLNLLELHLETISLCFFFPMYSPSSRQQNVISPVWVVGPFCGYVIPHSFAIREFRRKWDILETACFYKDIYSSGIYILDVDFILTHRLPLGFISPSSVCRVFLLPHCLLFVCLFVFDTTTLIVLDQDFPSIPF